MTGFARVRRPLGDGELVVSVKSLNHRGLDVQVHAPSAVDPFENADPRAGEEPHGARPRRGARVAAAGTRRTDALRR